MLQQSLISLEEAIARQPPVDRQALQGDLQRLLDAGVLVETEMR
jgi:hypothetical protein